MLCRRCMTVMATTGTRYEQNNGKNKPSYRRYYECNKCNDRVYTNAPNFQEYMNKLSEKRRNK